MKSKFFYFLIFNIILSSNVFGQNRNAFLLENYNELPNPVMTNSNDWKDLSGVKIGWGSTDVRYKKEQPATFNSKENLEIRGWRGEKVSAQLMVSNNDKDFELSYEITPLIKKSSKRERISTSNISTGFVRYVMTDELNKDKTGTCGHRKPEDFEKSLSADAIDHLTKKLLVENKSSRSVWIGISIPETAKPGFYQGKVFVKRNNKVMKTLNIFLNVSKNVLPNYSKWNFHLDLWQNPYSVARIYNLKPWSKEHFEKLRIEMMPYVKAGGKVITTTIIDEPWGGQTYDHYGSMITWTKKADGTWNYDFSVFDQWVEFMMSLGVDKQINCYSMIPWKLSFQYFDEASNSVKYLETKPGEKPYEEFWGNMLTAFAKHLKQKGWFDKTYISMDERPMQAMQHTLKVIKKADENFKVSLAGALHRELINDLDDYCVALRMKFTQDEILKRKAAGKITTFYTSCEEPYPNTFTFSNPSDSEWFGWYAAKENLDGYLRWAYNSWVENPLQDSRFRSWGAGDTYFVYPGGRSSVRFEKLIDGIQSFEKLMILREKYDTEKNQKGLVAIQKALNLFDENKLKEKSSSDIINEAKMIIRNAGIDF